MKVAVIGAGCWGAWSAYLLQQASLDVALIDMFGAGNSRSGSGGESRVIRSVYGTDEIYVKMVAESYPLWEELFEETKTNLYTETGLLWMAQDDTAYLDDCAPLMEKWGFDLEKIAIDEAQKRFPIFNLDDVKHCYFEPKAGLLEARNCCQLLARTFVKNGGQFIQSKLEKIEEKNGKCTSITLSNGSKLEADFFVFALGPWNLFQFQDLLSEIEYISRQEVYYFGLPEQDSNNYTAQNAPIWLDYNPDSDLYYGLPSHHNRGFKIAYDYRTIPFDPRQEDRNPTPKLVENARKYIGQRFLKLKNAPLVEARVCQYENSIDGHFIIDHHPRMENTLILGGSSGHGFKMGPAVGKFVQSFLVNQSSLPSFFSLQRFEKGVANQSQFGQSA